MSRASTTVKLLGVDAEVESLVGRVTIRAGQLEHVLALVVRRTGQMTFDEAMESLHQGELRDRKKLTKWVRSGLKAWAKANNQSCDADAIVDRAIASLRQRDELAAHCCYAEHDGEQIRVRFGTFALVDRGALKSTADDLLRIIVELTEITNPDLVRYSEVKAKAEQHPLYVESSAVASAIPSGPVVRRKGPRPLE